MKVFILIGIALAVAGQTEQSACNNNQRKDNGETGVDCGGINCAACQTTTTVVAKCEPACKDGHVCKGTTCVCGKIAACTGNKKICDDGKCEAPKPVKCGTNPACTKGNKCNGTKCKCGTKDACTDKQTCTKDKCEDAPGSGNEAVAPVTMVLGAAALFSAVLI